MYFRARAHLDRARKLARKVQGIDVGADDYVSTFRVEEVLARLRALIRRASGLAHAELR
jgi:two-component system OmpR family response regulator